MKLASIIILISTLCFTAPAMAEEWPQTARAPRVYGRRNTPTNAELLQRGLTPSRPRKMYEAKALEARQGPLVSTPSVVPSGDVVFRFVECRSGIDYEGAYQLTFTSLRDLADQCAALQISDGGPEPQTFAIQNFPNDYNCYTAAIVRTQLGIPQSCEEAFFGNYAIYRNA